MKLNLLTVKSFSDIQSILELNLLKLFEGGFSGFWIRTWEMGGEKKWEKELCKKNTCIFFIYFLIYLNF